MKAYIHHYFVKLSKKFSRQGLYEFLAEKYSRIQPLSRVLTIGAEGGVNKLLDKYAQSAGFEVISFDIDEIRKPDLLGDICNYDFGESKFDVVVMSEVLEHLHSPHLALKNVYSILKEKGTLILTVPFLFPIHDKPHDYYRYTRYGLAFLLRDFAEVQIRERNSYFEATQVLYVRLLHTKKQRDRYVAYVFILLTLIQLPITKALSKLVPSDAVTTGYVVTAIKPS